MPAGNSEPGAGTSPATGLSVAIAGASGYVGGELLRLLAVHPAVGSCAAYSESHAGARLADVHPALRHVEQGRQTFEAGRAADAAKGADVLFLALPHGRSQEVIDDVLAAAPGRVIDLAADFRIHHSGLYESYYGPHRAPDRVGEFVYALADDPGCSLAGATRIAVPGCFATAASLALLPLAKAGLVTRAPVVFAITGSTGSGAVPRPTTHHPHRAHNFYAYSTAGHRHEAEVIEQVRGWTGNGELLCHMAVHSAPIVRGIHVTAHVHAQRPLDEPLALLRSAWAGQPFVHVLDAPPQVAAVAGTNHAHVFAAARDRGREVLSYCAIDNLVKGAAGQAVQAMNLALGLDARAGLDFAGLYPC